MLLDFVIAITATTTFITVRNDAAVLFTIEDHLNGYSDLSFFKRIIKENGKEKFFYFEDGEIKLHHYKINTKYIDTIPKDPYQKNPKILTLDFETRNISTIHTLTNNKIISKKIPVAMSIYDGKQSYSYIFKNRDT